MDDFLILLSQSVPPLFPVMFSRQLQSASESGYPLPLQNMLTSVIEWAKQKEKPLVCEKAVEEINSTLEYSCNKYYNLNGHPEVSISHRDLQLRSNTILVAVIPIRDLV